MPEPKKPAAEKPELWENDPSYVPAEEMPPGQREFFDRMNKEIDEKNPAKPTR